jgi:predicted HD phosphohydrolase
VDAKRYLCATRPGYEQALSADSQRSLVLQGGVFSIAEAAAFSQRPGAEDAVRVRLWDDLAKSADTVTPPLAHFIERARRCALA